MMKAWWVIVAGALSLTVQADEDGQRLAERLYECRVIESSLERLDCYDRLAREHGEMDAAAADGEARGAERAQAAQERAAERSNEFGREHRQREDSESKRYITVEEYWQNPHGLWRFLLDDGSEWHQTGGGGNVRLDQDANFYIERGVFNSFRLSHDDTNRSIRVQRVD